MDAHKAKQRIVAIAAFAVGFNISAASTIHMFLGDFNTYEFPSY